MAEKLTPQQAQAVRDRGGKLLVSAAAGSGKTKVLVDRLMRYVMDPVDPANLDDFLIITYTKAAAAELRGKIAAKLSEKIAEEPENRHLQQQMQRLYLAKISTVHSFCSDVLREYAYYLDLSADFRVADENECAQLRERAMLQLLDDSYQNVGEDPDFCAFVDTQGLGRTDALVPVIVSKVYDSARCHLDPEAYLDRCISGLETEELLDASETLWGQYLIDDLYSFLDLQIAAMDQCAQLAADQEGWGKPATIFADTVLQLKHLRSSKTWDEICQYRKIDYGTLRFPKKGGDPEIAEKIKAIRECCKKQLGRKLQTFADPSEKVLEDLRSALPSVRGLIHLARQFGDRYSQMKRSRRIVDFGDLEHLALDLFLGKHRSGPTAAAGEVGARFREIMVDEYQDSNAVQDAIFTALTEKRQNLFMVGDVKQSIYQFRLADPGIFLEKYAAYANADSAKPGEGRKIMLSNNFRSSAGVIEAVNHVFRKCMSPKVGGLEYGDDEALYEGIPHCSLEEPEVELHTLTVRENTYPEEAAYTAERIAGLLDGKHMIREGEGLRPIKPEDIVILLRSPGSVGAEYQRALEQRGISCTTGSGTDLLQTREITALRSLLQTISNPRQDIPLAAVLFSPVFGWSADELAEVRKHNKGISLYETLCNSSTQKAQSFLKILNKLRTGARMYSITQLVEECLLETGVDSVFSAMADGELRKENIQTFYQICADFESSGHKDLEQFLSYLDSMEEKGLVTGREGTSPGSVTIMSIHKSKGLEFPVVFLCGLSREFNRESLRAQVLCDKELGLGMSCVDGNLRIRYPSIAKRAIVTKQQIESTSEELRVLYVAMTRARDRLIMIYSSKKLEDDLRSIALRSDISGRELLTMEAICPGDWVLYASMQRTEAGALFALGGKPEETNSYDSVWKITVDEAPEAGALLAKSEAASVRIPEEVFTQMRQSFSFHYPHQAATCAPSKQTATQRKGRQKDTEAQEHAGEQKMIRRTWRKASFSGKALQGKEYGNAIHGAMQYISYERCADVNSVREEIRRLVDERYISPEQGEIVDAEKIAAFFATPLGEKIRTSEHVIREFKFSILDDGKEYAEDLQGDEVLLQGVVDCALIEPDGITVVDFKTDRVDPKGVLSLAEHYRPQVLVYADALGKIFELPVKEKYLYLFQLNEFYPL